MVSAENIDTHSRFTAYSLPRLQLVVTQRGDGSSVAYHSRGLASAEHSGHPQQIAWKSMCATQEGLAKGERCASAPSGATRCRRSNANGNRSIVSPLRVSSRCGGTRIDTLYARYGLEMSARRWLMAKPTSTPLWIVHIIAKALTHEVAMMLRRRAHVQGLTGVCRIVRAARY